MHSADAYTAGLFSYEDLPDEVIMFHNDTGPVTGPLIVSKNAAPVATIYGPMFYGTPPDPPDGPTLEPRIIYATDEWIAGVRQIDPGIGPCLAMDKFTITPQPTSSAEVQIWIFDNFADTYYISGLISGTVTRVDLCTWRGDGLTLLYDGRIGANFLPSGTFKWKVNGNNKLGFQNTPIGSYGGGFTIT